MDPRRSFQGLILALQRYWADYGCVILQPYDMEVGAGTFHPATTLRSLGPRPWNAAYVQPSRRPKDGRYGENPNRLQHYYQYQVILKPSPPDLQDLYLGSLDGDRHRPAAARHPLRRGRLGEPDARRLGARLGMLVRRHGGVAVHLFPAGGGLRLRAGLRRADLRAGAPRHVCAGRRQRLRAELQRPRRERAGHLRRRLPAGRAGIFALQFRVRRHRDAEAAFRGRRARVPGAARGRKAGGFAARIDWRFLPTTSASRRATSSTCSTRAASFR